MSLIQQNHISHCRARRLSSWDVIINKSWFLLSLSSLNLHHGSDLTSQKTMKKCQLTPKAKWFCLKSHWPPWGRDSASFPPPTSSTEFHLSPLVVCWGAKQSIHSLLSPPLALRMPRQRQLLSCSISGIKAEHCEQKVDFIIYTVLGEGQGCDGGDGSETYGNSVCGWVCVQTEAEWCRDMMCVTVRQCVMKLCKCQKRKKGFLSQISWNWNVICVGERVPPCKHLKKSDMYVCTISV